MEGQIPAGERHALGRAHAVGLAHQRQEPFPRGALARVGRGHEELGAAQENGGIVRTPGGQGPLRGGQEFVAPGVQRDQPRRHRLDLAQHAFAAKSHPAVDLEVEAAVEHDIVGADMDGLGSGRTVS